MSETGAASEIFFPQAASRLHEVFNALDPDFAMLQGRHVERLLARPHLDHRTRFLVLTSQYTMTQRWQQLEDHLHAAVQADVDVEELLEVILQAYVYTGPWVVSSACEVLQGVLGTAGIDMPLPASREPKSGRNLHDEQLTWTAADRDDPRLEHLIDRYGWGGISNGLRLRPGHHINMLDTLDALDPDFLQIWLDSVYDGMYGRGVVDDRTRLLCVVGATLAMGETHQSRRHMRAALRSGATGREVLEVIFQTTGFFGHPYVMPAAFDDLIRILDDEDRIEELIESERIAEVRRVVAARVARRDGVQDNLAPPRGGAEQSAGAAGS